MAEMYTTNITRTYIDTRPLLPSSATNSTKSTPTIPLLTTLQQSDQASVTRYRRPQDQLMSLASNLLKYHFIHTTCRIPWSAVRISRWPKPHQRPYWSPPSNWHANYGIEFNVSHQGGLVVLIGCRTPRPLGPDDLRPDNMVSSSASSHTTHDESGTGSQNDRGHKIITADPPLPPNNPRLGIDISCPEEPHRSPSNTIHTNADLYKWIDVFSEMFSDSERDEMKYSTIHTAPPLTTEPSGKEELDLKLRRFYTHWAAKEAFIKMIGEGLLAEWLRKLEFRNVVVPMPVRQDQQSSERVGRVVEAMSEIDIQDDDDEDDDNFDHSSRNTSSSTAQTLPDTWSEPHSNLVATLYSQTFISPPTTSTTTTPIPISTSIPPSISSPPSTSNHNHKLKMSLSTYGRDFIVAECLKDVREPPETTSSERAQPEQRWVSLDIERDIRPCTEGYCGCLDAL